MKNKNLVIFVGFIVSSTVFAETIDRSMTVTSVGAQSNHAYFRVAQPLSGQCLYDVVYIDTSTSGGRSQLSVVITSKALSRTLSVVSYTKDVAGMCWATTIEIL
jgi:CRISPR/Cas system-associated protein Csm6